MSGDIREAVCSLVIRNDFGSFLDVGTGFMISPRVLLTCHHLLGGPGRARPSVARFGGGEDLDASREIGLDPGALFLSSRDLDCTLVALSEDRPAWIPVDGSGETPVPGDRIQVVGRGEGLVREVSATALIYEMDTPSGSSGSPVLDVADRLVAVHHATVPGRGGLRAGMRIEGIREHFGLPESIRNSG